MFTLGISLLTVRESCKHTPIDFLSETPVPIIDDTTGGGGVDTIVYSNCDPDTVYFVNDVFPIIVSNCAISGCHDNITHKEGINLSSYDEIIGSGLLDLGDPWNSDFIDKATPTGDERMPPPPMPKLTTSQLQAIVSWQEQGALNNECTYCDTSAVTYAATIHTIMSSYCTGCHDHTSPAGNVDLTAYYGTGSYLGVSDVAANGKLYGTITFAPGFSAMPQGGTSLPNCLIDQIRIWIEAGYPNN